MQAEPPLQDWADSNESRVRRVVEAASRRSSLVLIVDRSSLALAAVFAGAALLLLLGTQILNWPWLVLLAALGAGLTAVQVRRRILTRYRVAQILDRRLQLSDSLSTAWFLLGKPESPADSLAQAQIERAAESARTVEPASVFPFVWQRSWALAGALAAVAFGLFALRYLVTNSLDLKQGLIPNPFSYPVEVLERLQKWAGRDSDAKRLPLEATGPTTRPGDGPHKDDGSREGENKLAGETAPKNAAESAKAQASPKPDGETGNRVNNPEQTDPSGKSGEKNGAAEGKQQTSADNNRSQDRPREQNPGQQSSPGLLDRMKDAFSGLMAKTQPHDSAPKENEPERASQEPKPGEQNGQNGSQKQPGSQSAKASQPNPAGNRQQGMQSQGEAQASEKPAATQSRASDESASRKGSDAQSGIGRQDGEKSLKEAEQLRAMGKLDEIIGKRSSTLTGDMTVETHSGNQQLQTKYSGRTGYHADLGGEIDRNEVPVALQRYVREYMEQVRKQANEK